MRTALHGADFQDKVLPFLSPSALTLSLTFAHPGLAALAPRLCLEHAEHILPGASGLTLLFPFP